MLISILSNLVMESGVIPPPVTQHNVPDTYVEEKGGYGEKLKEQEEEEGIRKIIIQDDEEILLLIAAWIAKNNSN